MKEYTHVEKVINESKNEELDSAEKVMDQMDFIGKKITEVSNETTLVKYLYLNFDTTRPALSFGQCCVFIIFQLIIIISY